MRALQQFRLQFARSMSASLAFCANDVCSLCCVLQLCQNWSCLAKQCPKTYHNSAPLLTPSPLHVVVYWTDVSWSDVIFVITRMAVAALPRCSKSLAHFIYFIRLVYWTDLCYSDLILVISRLAVAPLLPCTRSLLHFIYFIRLVY